VVRVVPDTGDRTVLSGCTAYDPETASCTASIGTGPPLTFPKGIAVTPDGSLVVTDAFGVEGEGGVVVRVVPDTGNRTVLSGCTAYDFETASCTGPIIGTGPPLVFPRAIAVEPDGSLVVADSDWSGAVVRVAPDTGDRIVLSGCSATDFDFLTASCTGPIIGTGPPLVFPSAIAVEPDGSLVVAEVDIGITAGAVVRVNPVTGDRVLISGLDDETNMNIGNGPLFVYPEDIAVEANGSLIVVDSSLKAVVRVDPFTGNRTLISR
jgi:sugar lactone lactonase YvrE